MVDVRAIAARRPFPSFETARGTPWTRALGEAGELESLRVLATKAALKVVGTVHRVMYRASEGHLGGMVQGGPVVLLTTIGRRSGRERTWPLCCLRDGAELIIVASAGGSSRHPGWYLNLQANRHVLVQQGSRRQTMLARTAEAGERARLWVRIVRQYPACAIYQRRTDRPIPVVVLEPIDRLSAKQQSRVPGP